MTAKKAKSSVLAKYGDKISKALVKHKDDEITYPKAGGDVPAGVDGGIAQLVDCYFDLHKDGENKGKPFFYMAGVAKSPDEIVQSANGKSIAAPVKGLRVSAIEPLYETPNRKSRQSVDDHVAYVTNEMKKLGIDISEYGDDAEDLESMAEALQEAKPHFKFRSWKGKPNKDYPDPRTNYDFNGTTDWTDEGGGDEVVDDSNGEEEEEEGKEEASDKAGWEGDDLAEMGDAADNNNDKAAIAELIKRAEEAEIDYDSLPSWVAVAEALAGGDEEETEPEKGQSVEYKPPKAKRAVECEVTAVFKKDKTVNLKNTDDGKSVYKAVPWDKIEV